MNTLSSMKNERVNRERVVYYNTLYLFEQNRRAAFFSKKKMKRKTIMAHFKLKKILRQYRKQLVADMRNIEYFDRNLRHF